MKISAYILYFPESKCEVDLGALAMKKRLFLPWMWGEGKREVPQRRNHLTFLLGREGREKHSLQREGPEQKGGGRNRLGIWGYGR